MLHSYEGLDRPGGFSRARLLAPLRHRDFRLLWSGMCISLLGDGVFMVAMAWQVYALSNAPTALSLVGIAMTVPTIVFLLLGGVVSDRLDRRRIMLSADVARGARGRRCSRCCRCTGALELWHVVALVAVYGAGRGVLRPGVRRDRAGACSRPTQLAQANSLDQFVRPIALRLAGPALGGVLIDAVGAGAAFALDAASFLVSAAALLAMRRGPRDAGARRRLGRAATSARAWRYVRGHAWLWATFASAAVAYLLFMGPAEVLLPFIVKNELGGERGRPRARLRRRRRRARWPARSLIGQRGLPRRDITFMYVAWTLATLAVAGYGARGRRLAAHARQPRLQRARDRRHDRVGDGEAAPRARGAARPRLEPGLADLDRPAAALLRPHRAR